MNCHYGSVSMNERGSEWIEISYSVKVISMNAPMRTRKRAKAANSNRVKVSIYSMIEISIWVIHGGQYTNIWTRRGRVNLRWNIYHFRFFVISVSMDSMTRTIYVVDAKYVNRQRIEGTERTNVCIFSCIVHAWEGVSKPPETGYVELDSA